MIQGILDLLNSDLFIFFKNSRWVLHLLFPEWFYEHLILECASLRNNYDPTLLIDLPDWPWFQMLGAKLSKNRHCFTAQTSSGSIHVAWSPWLLSSCGTTGPSKVAQENGHMQVTTRYPQVIPDCSSSAMWSLAFGSQGPFKKLVDTVTEKWVCLY